MVTSIDLVASDEDNSTSVSQSCISELIVKWRIEENKANFDDLALLNEFCVKIEEEYNTFLKRDPDPFEERPVRKIPCAGNYEVIYDDLFNNSDFIIELMTKYINMSLTVAVPEKQEATLRFMCTVFTCVNIRDIFTNFDDDIREQFTNRMFELTSSETYPLNLYATCMLGYLTKEDESLLSQFRERYHELTSTMIKRIKPLLVNLNNNSESNLSTDESSIPSYQTNSNEWMLSKVDGVIKINIELRIMLFFLRQIAETTYAADIMQNENVLVMISQLLTGKNFNDNRVIFETLRFLMKLMCHRSFYMDFYEKYDGVNLLLNVPRDPIAGGAITYCLFNLITHHEVIEKFVIMPKSLHEQVMDVCLWTVETCQPSSRCYAMLCIQHLIRHNKLLVIFEEMSGPRVVLNCFATLQTVLINGDSHRSMKKDGTYYALLRTTFNTLKVSLEQSLLVWSKDVDLNVNNELFDDSVVLSFPEIESPFTHSLSPIIPAALYYQTWRHPYLSDKSNLIKLIYSYSDEISDDVCNFFDDAFNTNSNTNLNDIIYSSLDVLSLLCLSNKFVNKLFDFNVYNTKPGLKLIFSLLSKKPSKFSINNIKAVKSILFFLSVLCCRPFQLPSSTNQSSLTNGPRSDLKRKHDESSSSDSDSDADTPPPKMMRLQDLNESFTGYPDSHRSKYSRPSLLNGQSYLQTPVVNSTPTPESIISNHSELQQKLWCLVRSYNIIRRLLSLIEAVVAPLDILTIRTWICHILTGVSRSADIKAMLQKLPIVRRNILEEKIFEGQNRDSCSDNVEFRRVAKKLGSVLFANDSAIDSTGRDMRPAHVKRADIVDNTKIQWDKSELVSVIFNYLKSEGYQSAAEQLRLEANLDGPPRSPELIETIHLEPIPAPTSTPKHEAVNKQTNNSCSVVAKTPPQSPAMREIMSSPFIRPPTVTTPINIKIPNKQTRTTTAHNNAQLTSVKHQNQHVTNNNVINKLTKPICLDDLVESYLRNQHAQCKHPISICPKFSLHNQHHCPSMDEEMTMRSTHNVINFLMNRSSYDTSRYSVNNRVLHKYVHQKFKPRTTLYESDVFENERLFTDHFCFSHDEDDGLFFASMDQNIVYTNIDMAHQPIHVGETDFPISNMECTKDGRLLVVSSFHVRRPISGPVINLFDVSRRHETPPSVIKQFNYSGYSELSKKDDSKLVVTKGKTAQIVDMETGILLYTCQLSSQTTKNRSTYATFSYDDNLLFHYGILWDVRFSHSRGSISDTYLHEFDNLEDVVSGVFHPNGHEIIIGSSIWDLRQFRLQRNIPSLKGCKIKFNGSGDFFYTYKDSLNQYPNNPIISGHNLFSCYDSRDYSIVATVNTNRVIQALAVDPKDLDLAVLEAYPDSSSLGQCRIYSVGYRSDRSYVEDGLDDVEEELVGNSDDDGLELFTDTDFDDDDDDSFYMEYDEGNGMGRGRSRRLIFNIASTEDGDNNSENDSSNENNAQEFVMDLSMLGSGDDDGGADDNTSAYDASNLGTDEIIESVDGDDSDEDSDSSNDSEEEDDEDESESEDSSTHSY